VEVEILHARGLVVPPADPLGEGEVPADLLARLGKTAAQSAPSAGRGVIESPRSPTVTLYSVRCEQEKAPGTFAIPGAFDW
jgi:hypothetical protein